MLFVHGTPSWSFEWRHAIRALRAEARCVAPDRGPEPTALGQRARDYWIMRDGCMAANPMPAMPAPCVAYQGCRPGFPVAWCQHAETACSGTGHAWPTWATKAIWTFFASL